MKLLLELPEPFIKQLEDRLAARLEAVLDNHVAKINAEPELLGREEASRILKVSLPTLNKFEKDGLLIPQRAGKRVLYDRGALQSFLKSRRPQ